MANRFEIKLTRTVDYYRKEKYFEAGLYKFTDDYEYYEMGWYGKQYEDDWLLLEEVFSYINKNWKKDAHNTQIICIDDNLGD